MVVARGNRSRRRRCARRRLQGLCARQPSGDTVALHTHHVVRDDAQQLFGFETRDELALFELLITVSGVGPRAGLALLSVSSPRR
jgi:Holliday junction DNA helicase RuvA